MCTCVCREYAFSMLIPGCSNLLSSTFMKFVTTPSSLAPESLRRRHWYVTKSKCWYNIIAITPSAVGYRLVLCVTNCAKILCINLRVKQTFFAFTLKYNPYTSVQPCTIELGCRKLSLQKRTNFLMIVNWNLKQFFKINTQTTAYKGTLFI